MRPIRYRRFSQTWGCYPMISELTLAMVGGLGLKDLARTIHPYPTQAEAMKRAGDAYNRTRLTPFVKRWFDRWLAWTR